MTRKKPRTMGDDPGSLQVTVTLPDPVGRRIVGLLPVGPGRWRATRDAWHNAVTYLACEAHDDQAVGQLIHALHAADPDAYWLGWTPDEDHYLARQAARKAGY